LWGSALKKIEFHLKPCQNMRLEKCFFIFEILTGNLFAESYTYNPILN
jgi:hypothetical protein